MKHRTHPVVLILATAVAFSAIWVLCRAQTLNIPPKYLLTEKHLVLLSAPQVVAGPVVLDAKWSPDGVRVAAIRSTERYMLDSPVPELRLVVWSAGRQSREMWRMDMSPDAMPRVAWITPEIVTVELKWHEKVQGLDPAGKVIWSDMPHQSVLWVDATRDQVKTIPEIPGDRLYVSPTRPLAFLFSPIQRTLTLLKPDGNAIKKLPLPDKTVWRKFHEADDWAEDGIHVLLDAQETTNDGSETDFRQYALNAKTGEIQLDWKSPLMTHVLPQPELRLTRTDQEIKLGRRTQRLHPLWLESAGGGEQPQALLTSDSSAGKISPLGTSVLYLSDHAAFVTPLRIGPKEPFLTALKARLGSNAKQLGLAMRMYAADYDDALPSADLASQNVFEPYHKNNDLYEGFNYSFPGGALPPTDQLSATQIGSVDGPGGKWIIYGDGHVHWTAP